MLHFASATANIGPFMEYPWRAPEKADSRVSPNPRIENGKVKVPTGPGFGLQFDPDFLKKAVKVETC
jgi:L-alanine-DL-glutamate epimerase-like enolase superfamily enzyme